MITDLKTKKVINIIEEKSGTSQQPLLVLSDDFKPYYLKTPKSDNPEIYIIKEFLCHFLLNCWSLKTPSIAALIVDPKSIHLSLSAHHKSNYFDRTCFGSESLDNSFDFFTLISLSNKYDFNRYKSPDDLLKLGLFDIWIENDDRKPTNPNLLVQDSGIGFDFYAIDHALTLSSLKFTDLNPALDLGVSFNDSILYTEIAQIIFFHSVKSKNNWIDGINDYFYFAISNSKSFYNKIINSIPGDLGFSSACSESLYNFLFSDTRNKLVFDEFLGRFKK